MPRVRKTRPDQTALDDGRADVVGRPRPDAQLPSGTDADTCELRPRQAVLQELRGRVHQLAVASGNTFDGITSRLREMLGRRPVVLDLFSGAGGCGMGYSQAGFDVIGIDHVNQPRYPFEFYQADWAAGLAMFAIRADVIHSSPPCQRYSITNNLPNTKSEKHVDLLAPVRDALLKIGKPYIIENVMGAPLGFAVMLCGLSFDLKVFRHRFFESNVFLFCPPHTPHGDRRIGVDGYACVAGHGGGTTASKAMWRTCAGEHRNKRAWEKAMGIDWMTRDQLAQAIPPAYTKYLGNQLLNYLLQQEPPKPARRAGR